MVMDVPELVKAEPQPKGLPNLNELIMCFDMVNNLPEINAIQNGMRQKTRA